MCLSASDRPSLRVLLGIGMICLFLALTSQGLHLSFGLATSPLDFLRGFLLGFAVVLIVCASIAIRRQRRAP